MNYSKPQLTSLGDAKSVIQGVPTLKQAAPIKDNPFPDEVSSAYVTEE